MLSVLCGAGIVFNQRNFSLGFLIHLNLGSARGSRTNQEPSGARHARTAGATIYDFQIKPMDLSLSKRTWKFVNLMASNPTAALANAIFCLGGPSISNTVDPAITGVRWKPPVFNTSSAK